MERKKLIIGPDKVDDPAISVTPSYKIRTEDNAEWELLSDEIDGFEHEPGIEAEIEVEVVKDPSPPPGASSLRYKLIRVLEKRKP